MLALAQAVTSRLKKISPLPAHIFYDSNHLQIMPSRLKKIFPLLTCIFLTYIHQQSVHANYYQIDLKKIYTSYVFLLKAKIDPTIKKMVVVRGIFS